MIQNAALDVAIALTLMYLMLSLLCTIVNEYIASKLGLRAASLAAGLQEILDDPWVREKFYAHGLIASAKNAVTNSKPLLWSLVTKFGDLQASVADAKRQVADAATKAAAATQAAAAEKIAPAAQTGAGENKAVVTPPKAPPPENHPSYISSTNFTMALLGSLDTKQPVPGIAEIEATVTSMNHSNLRTALLSALATADGDLDKLRKNVATWFDDSMERLSGAYKRHLKLISIIVGLAVAVLLNADSFKVAHTLWSDSDLRAQVAASATAFANRTPSGNQGKTDEQKLKDALDNTSTLRPLPIGWTCRDEDWLLSCMAHSTPSVTLSQFLGWLLTAAALSLGAPFWFDILSKLVNIRGTGPKPERADSKK
jgi:hypothetical protein